MTKQLTHGSFFISIVAVIDNKNKITIYVAKYGIKKLLTKKPVAVDEAIKYLNELSKKGISGTTQDEVSNLCKELIKKIEAERQDPHLF